MPCVRYKVQGAEGSEGCFTVPGHDVTLQAITEQWPFEGRFHFRVKMWLDQFDGTAAKRSGESAFAWFDVVDNEPLPLCANEEAVIKAVYLDDLPCFGDPPTHPDVGASADPHEAVDDATIAAVADAVEMEYANRCAIHAAQFPAINAAAAPKPSPPPTPRTRGGAGAGVGAGAGDFAARMGLADGVGADVARVAAHAVGNAAAAASAATTAASAAASQLASDASKGMRKMFNAGRFLAKVGMKRVMSGGGRAGKVPTVDALVNVQDMQVHFNTPFTAEFGPHEQLLRKLWQSAYPKARMVRVSPKWQRLGFQQSDPSTDFRGGGVLSLKCLVYMAENYPVPFQAIIDAQAPQTSRHYPVAAASINMTTMLARRVHLDADSSTSGGRGVAQIKEPFWGVFTQYDAFFELFCLTLRLFDRVWASTGGRIEEFSKTLAVVDEKVAALLSAGPTSLEQLMDAAMRQGLLG